MIKPLLEEGKIFKWGSRAMPYERYDVTARMDGQSAVVMLVLLIFRYMPNVKAPEYYEVTGESLPAVPDVDETEYLTKIKKSLLKSNEDYEDLAKEGEEEVELTEEEQQFGENDEDTTVSGLFILCPWECLEQDLMQRNKSHRNHGVIYSWPHRQGKRMMMVVIRQIWFSTWRTEQRVAANNNLVV